MNYSKTTLRRNRCSQFSNNGNIIFIDSELSRMLQHFDPLPTPTHTHTTIQQNNSEKKPNNNKKMKYRRSNGRRVIEGDVITTLLQWNSLTTSTATFIFSGF